MGATFPEGWSTFFLAVSRNKRFTSIDYHTPEGQSLIRDLTRRADVFLENARPGAWDAYGLDAKSLQALNPGLIYASVSGFGSEGPMRDWLSMDLIAQAVGGIMGITGSEEGGPARVGGAIVDVVAGRLAAFGIVTALFDRVRTGRGQRVETSLFSAAVSMLSMREVEYQFTGENPQLTGTAHGQLTPAQAFVTKDGRRVMLCCYSDPLFSRWTRAAGHEELLSDTRFATNGARRANREAVVAAVQTVMLERTEAEWTAILAASCPMGRCWSSTSSGIIRRSMPASCSSGSRCPTSGRFARSGAPSRSRPSSHPLATSRRPSAPTPPRCCRSSASHQMRLPNSRRGASSPRARVLTQSRERMGQTD